VSRTTMAWEYGEGVTAAEEEARAMAAKTAEGFTGEEVMLASLVPDPRPEELLISVVPCLVPVAAASQFKYKAKIVPGKGKRGKVALSAVEAAIKALGKGGATAREAELLRLVPEEQLVQVMLSDVALAAPTKK
jgi:NFACT protein C-terminal domain